MKRYVVTWYVCQCGRGVSVDWVALWDFCPACGESPFPGRPVMEPPATIDKGAMVERRASSAAGLASFVSSPRGGRA